MVALAPLHGAKGHTYTTAEAKDHIGEDATVVGLVTKVSVARKAEFLNFDGEYPNQLFSAVIFAVDYDRVGEVKTYEGRKVAVTGTIKLFHGKPQITVKSSEALKVQ
jgi:hypothetical protein